MLGEFNAHGGDSGQTWRAVIWRNSLSDPNLISALLVNFCDRSGSSYVFLVPELSADLNPNMYCGWTGNVWLNPLSTRSLIPSIRITQNNSCIPGVVRNSGPCSGPPPWGQLSVTRLVMSGYKNSNMHFWFETWCLWWRHLPAFEMSPVKTVFIIPLVVLETSSAGETETQLTTRLFITSAS